MKLIMSFDLEANGYSEENFRDNPASAMRVMFDRAQSFLHKQDLIMHNDQICTPMGQPIARLNGWPAPDLDL